MSNDSLDGYNAGRSGNIFGPNSAEAIAGWLAGSADRQGTPGSAEWLIAPVALWPLVAICYPVATIAFP